MYKVPAVDIDGKVHHIQAYGIERITSSSVLEELRKAVEGFKGIKEGDIEIP